MVQKAVSTPVQLKQIYTARKRSHVGTLRWIQLLSFSFRKYLKGSTREDTVHAFSVEISIAAAESARAATLSAMFRRRTDVGTAELILSLLEPLR